MDEDFNSTAVDLSHFDTHGFCRNYPHRRHNFEYLANQGCHEARSDWTNLIFPVSEFGSYNPINGNFNAVVLPLCKPERLSLVSYILEYAFIHDTIVEKLNPAVDAFALSNGIPSQSSVDLGRKQMQTKMMKTLLSIDEKCAKRVIGVWKTMLSTTMKDKTIKFENLEQYLDFRIIDTGAPFVESLMLFGMALNLTREEESLLAEIIRPCYASLALANDYFSFDREWEEAQATGAERLTNAVWLYMQWTGASATSAKRMVRDACNEYENKYLDSCRADQRPQILRTPRIDLYLRALSYQVSGNVVWSLNCPRYHPEYRYDASASPDDMSS